MHRFVDMSQSILHKYHVVELLYIIIDTMKVNVCRTQPTVNERKT